MIRLNDLEAKAKAATPGIWRGGRSHQSIVTDGHGDESTHRTFGEIGAYGGPLIAESFHKTNSDFVVSAQPSTVLALIRIARATLAYHTSVKENQKERSIELHNALKEIE